MDFYICIFLIAFLNSCFERNYIYHINCHRLEFMFTIEKKVLQIMKSRFGAVPSCHYCKQRTTRFCVCICVL